MTQPTWPQYPPPPQPAAPEPPKKGLPLWVKITLIAAPILWLIGCSAIIGAIGSDDPEAEPSPVMSTVPASTAPARPGPARAIAYASVTDLRDAVVGAGYPCPKWELNGKGDGPQLAKESGSCTDEDVFSIYANTADVTKQAGESVGVIEMLAGPNWILNLGSGQEGRDTRRKVQAVIGGKLIEEGELTADNMPEPEADAAPKKSDFKLKVKVLDKECFGSAGCIVQFRIIPQYSGPGLPDEGTIELSYKITGGEDPELGTIEIECPDGSYSSEERDIDTPSSSSTVRAKITDLELS